MATSSAAPKAAARDDWVDFDFFGHQIVAHKVAAPAHERRDEPGRRRRTCRCGTSAWCSTWPTWRTLATRFEAAGVEFVIEPYVRFKGEPGEQATMFFLDPFGNALEFKAFADMNALFA